MTRFLVPSWSFPAARTLDIWAFYLDEDGDRIQVLGGNQGDAVTIAWFPKVNLLGYREPTGWMSV